jgi:hypothetical protein
MEKFCKRLEESRTSSLRVPHPTERVPKEFLIQQNLFLWHGIFREQRAENVGMNMRRDRRM